MESPPQSMQMLLTRLCSQMESPPQHMTHETYWLRKMRGERARTHTHTHIPTHKHTHARSSTCPMKCMSYGEAGGNSRVTLDGKAHDSGPPRDK